MRNLKKALQRKDSAQQDATLEKVEFETSKNTLQTLVAQVTQHLEKKVLAPHQNEAVVVCAQDIFALRQFSLEKQSELERLHKEIQKKSNCL